MKFKHMYMYVCIYVYMCVFRHVYLPQWTIVHFYTSWIVAQCAKSMCQKKQE